MNFDSKQIQSFDWDKPIYMDTFLILIKIFLLIRYNVIVLVVSYQLLGVNFLIGMDK